MATETELAIFSHSAYQVGDINKLPLVDWSTSNLSRTLPSGFSENVYVQEAGLLVEGFASKL